MSNEELLVIPDKFVKERFGYGFRPVLFTEEYDDTWLYDIMNESDTMPRELAEKNTDYRQVVPYVLVKTSQKKYLTFTRKPTQGEKLLHGLSGIGIGGHANIGDLGIIEHPIIRAAQRELMEELDISEAPGISFNIPFPEKLFFLGTIAGTEEPVDLVHIGFVFRWDVENEVAVREKDQMSYMYMPINAVAELPNLEPWTKAILGYLYYGSTRPREVDWKKAGV
jgi:predicted NUDIX family phosphoesterase